MRNKVPVDLAFQMDEVMRAAWCIVFSEFEGAQFDWSTMRFVESK